MSGYEQSPDYGGQDPGPLHWLKVVLLLLALVLAGWSLAKYGDWFDRTGGPIGILTKSN